VAGAGDRAEVEAAYRVSAREANRLLDALAPLAGPPVGATP
jgi:hypothetical protein